MAHRYAICPARFDHLTRIKLWYALFDHLPPPSRRIKESVGEDHFRELPYSPDDQVTGRGMALKGG